LPLTGMERGDEVNTAGGQGLPHGSK